VVLGHIDHGKTSILDYIRKTHVVEKESGGITQHIGAYQIEHQNKKITFIDTPGHEAFSQMRSRGAKIADIAILIVDASEGVKEQTKEAISHIKLAEIPLIVALNKIDKPEADPQKARRELAKEEILIESIGGKIPSIEVSAKTGKGIEDLLELILLIAEMEDLKTDKTMLAEGVVIESYLDSLRGPTTTLLLTQGTLRGGEIIGTNSTCGKIKNLENFQGLPLEVASPGDPIVVVGFEDCPRVGENFKIFPDIEIAKKHLKLPEKKTPEVLEILPDQKVLNLILKTDCLGSAEAIEEVFKNLPQEKNILRILKSEVGSVNETDVKLAKSGRALILGFRVGINPIAKNIAERDKVRILQFQVIYDLVEEIRKYSQRFLESKTERVDLGKVKALIIFLTDKNRQIVGGKVIEGEIKKGVSIEVFRGGELVGKGRLINLQKNKRDTERASKGEECGILYEGDVKIEEGDILLIYTEERKKEDI
jgi:translation initiation factor IF-2